MTEKNVTPLLVAVAAGGEEVEQHGSGGCQLLAMRREEVQSTLLCTLKPIWSPCMAAGGCVGLQLVHSENTLVLKSHHITTEYIDMYCWCLNSCCMFWLCQWLAYGYFFLLSVAKITDDSLLGFVEWFRSMCVPRFLRMQPTKINLIAFVLTRA